MTEYIMRYENEYLQLLPDKMQPLVRCKDCRHGYRCKNAAGEDAVECSNHYVSLEPICRQSDWFCADGDRKVGEGE